MSQSRLGELIDLAGDWTPPVFPLAGHDVKALGIPPGDRVGRLLAAVRDWWEAGDFTADRASCLARLREVAIGAPPAFAGVVVAVLILLPESVAAVAAARNNDLQKSINLALGSSLATIGLTIPAVAAAAYTLNMQLVLGLNAQNTALLLLTFMLSMLTFGTGRTNMLFGLVHMVVFAVFVFMVFVP